MSTNQIRHYEAARNALARTPAAWLERVLQRRVPRARVAAAYEHRPDDVKVVIDWNASPMVGTARAVYSERAPKRSERSTIGTDRRYA